MKQFYNTLLFQKRVKNLLRKSTAGLAILFASSSLISAQVNAYTFTQSTGTFTTLTGGTVLETATTNTGATSLYNVSYPVTMPFSFNYNGSTYSSLTVSSNGYVTFGGTDPSTGSTPISGTSDWDGSISAWGRSLNSMFSINNTTGDIRWETIGTAPNREIVIQWTNFRPSYSTSTTSVYSFSFQIRLKETSNQIITTYNSGSFLIGSTAVASTAQIGLRGKTIIDFNNRLNASTLAFTSSTTGTAASSTQYYSTTATAASGMPPAGFTYTWTPPTCFAPIPTTGSATPNSITVNWTSPAPAPASYDIYYSTTNTPPTSSTTPNQTNITGLTTTIGSLPPATVYYAWVRSNCGSGGYSAWSTQPISINTACQPPNLLSATGATICPGATAVLNATTNTGAVIRWYDSATAGSVIANGNAYTTPALTTTTNYWATAVRETQGFVGKQTIETGASTGGGLSSYMIFSVYSTFKLQTVDLYPFSSTDGTPGTVTIELRNSSGTVIASKIVNVIGHNSTANSIPQTVVLDFVIPPGSNYRLGVGAWTGITNMYRDSTNLAFPYSFAGVVDITGGSLATPYFYFFYNWGILTECETARQQVTATVNSSGCLSTSETVKKDVIRVYPNPFSDFINVDRIELIKTIHVSDTSGKLVKTITQPESVLRLEELSAGLYILQFDMKDGSQQTIKIIKK